jgi:hypothetical protein
MALDQRKRQKKLAKMKAKRRAKLAAQRRVQQETGLSTAASLQLELAVRAPIHECLVPENLFEMGIGNLVVSRRLGSGDLAASVFLVDVFCLGVKDAFFRVISRDEYEDFIDQASQHGPMNFMEPSCIRKLIEGAIAYARDLGFNPHKDYQLAKKMLEGIDAQACSMTFEFGKDGKPFFMSGPNETPARSRQIIETLTKRCGPDGFHYMVGLGGWMDDDEIDDEDEAFEEEDEEDEEGK